MKLGWPIGFWFHPEALGHECFVGHLVPEKGMILSDWQDFDLVLLRSSTYLVSYRIGNLGLVGKVSKVAY